MLEIEVKLLCVLLGYLVFLESAEHSAVCLIMAVQHDVVALVEIVIIYHAAEVGKHGSRLGIIAVEVMVKVIFIVIGLHNNVVDGCAANGYPARSVCVVIYKALHGIEHNKRLGSRSCGFCGSFGSRLSFGCSSLLSDYHCFRMALCQLVLKLCRFLFLNNIICKICK